MNHAHPLTQFFDIWLFETLTNVQKIVLDCLDTESSYISGVSFLLIRHIFRMDVSSCPVAAIFGGFQGRVLGQAVGISTCTEE